MKRNIFLTGFPGFLAAKVVETFFNKKARSFQGDDVTITALVQPAFYQQAEAFLAARPEAAGAVTLVKGDLCAPRLGLTYRVYDEIRGRVNEVMHLAALYRLDVPETLAARVNVDGTRRLLDFAAGVKFLRLFSHISSIIVSGKRTGVILENELHHRQGFHNHYEATKYMSEVLVADYRDRIPTAIFRPGVVVGDSRTGEIPKYDGPYYIIRAYRKLRFLPKILVPAPGDYGYAPFNMAPVDFVAEALVRLSGREESSGRTFHLTDKYPLTTFELFGLIHDKIFGPGKKLPLPGKSVRLFGRLPVGLGRLLGFSRSGAAYLDHMAIYDTRNSDELLAGTGIHCPGVHEYIDVMIDFVKDNPDIPLSI